LHPERSKEEQMRIALGADHAGFELKEAVRDQLTAADHSVLDVGTDSTESVDYPDFAAAVGRAVVAGRADRGIIICGSGAGASIAANKLNGIRCAQANDTYTAHQAVEHDDANMLALAARVTGPAVAFEVVSAFVGAEFMPQERYLRRLEKVRALERERS
jgi:ribose 5-phosphate isomerase B